MDSIRRVLCAVGCVGLACILAGCQTVRVQPFEMTRVAPKPGEVLKVDHVLIVADVTGSTDENEVFQQEKALLEAFVAAMPDMPYQMGFYSFAGSSQTDWTQVPLDTGTLGILAECASNLQYLGGKTPLHEAVLATKEEFETHDGNAALIVFSDGRTHPHERVIEACEAAAYPHIGPLCIYTVNVGYSKSGRRLLKKMANSTSCGKAWQTGEVNTLEGMEAMVREIFFEAGEVTEYVLSDSWLLFNSILFDFDKVVISPDGKAELDKLAAEWKKHPSDPIVVEGHTCDLGSAESNLELSQRRADAVKAYLVEQGIDGSRITTKAFGESQPAVPNESEADRKLNRRVQIDYRGEAIGQMVPK
jgi:OOP family OmpA-OmpF porin